MALKLHARARADLAEIWRYSNARWGEVQAEAYIRAVHAAFVRIAESPELGRPCDEVRQGYRKFPVNSHIIFYRRAKSDVAVVRVLHKRMDFSRHL